MVIWPPLLWYAFRTSCAAEEGEAEEEASGVVGVMGAALPTRASSFSQT